MSQTKAPYRPERVALSDTMREYQTALLALRQLRKQETNELALVKLDRHAFHLLCSLSGQELEEAKDMARIAWPPFEEDEEEAPDPGTAAKPAKIIAWFALAYASIKVSLALLRKMLG